METDEIKPEFYPHKVCNKKKRRTSNAEVCVLSFVSFCVFFLFVCVQESVICVFAEKK